jgi:SnoaL-like domain
MRRTVVDEVTEITQLVVRERQSRVRRRADQLRDCFHPDATVATSSLRGSAEAFAASARDAASRDSAAILNRLGPPLVHHAGRRAVVELPSTTTRSVIVNGAEAELTSFMRLLYRVERRDAGWRISDLTAVNEWDSLHPAVPGTDLRVDPKAVAGLRHSYRWLAYTRSLEGVTLSADLPGTDRLDAVNALYEAAFNWLGSQLSDERGGK